MKNHIFLWCRYSVKNWLKPVCTLKCKSTRLWNDNEFMPSNLHAFLWRTSTLFVTSSLKTQNGYEFCWKKKKKKKRNDRNYAIMKRIMLCPIKFGLLFKISNYHYCVFVSRQCTISFWLPFCNVKCYVVNKFYDLSFAAAGFPENHVVRCCMIATNDML